MIAAQRHSVIERLVKEKGSVTIEHLMELIPVSKMTLWRDISKLHELGRVRKVHGGAYKLEDTGKEPGFYLKALVNGDTKDHIAQLAAKQFIHDGDVVLLEGGTTVMHMVQHITRGHVSILTNGLNTLNAAASLEREISIMVCGGILRKPSLTFVGPEAQRFFHDFAADILFLSGTGITMERGVTDPNPLEIEVKRAMIQCARKLVVLMDSSKFYTQSLKTVVDIDQIDAFVTDNKAPKSFLDALRQKGIEVLVAN